MFGFGVVAGILSRQTNRYPYFSPCLCVSQNHKLSRHCYQCTEIVGNVTGKSIGSIMGKREIKKKLICNKIECHMPDFRLLIWRNLSEKTY